MNFYVKGGNLKKKVLLQLLLPALLFCTIPAFAEYELNLNKGIALYLEKNYSESIVYLEQAHSEDPDSPVANQMLGLSNYQLGNYQLSADYLEKAKQLDPGIEDINLELGNSYIKLNRYEEAEKVLGEYLSVKPNSGIGHYFLGYAQLLNGNYMQSIESFDKAIALNPDLTLQSNYYQGVSYYSLFKYHKARDKFLKVQEAAAPGDKLALSAQEYLQILRVLGKNYYASFSFGYQYDTNVALEPENVQIVSDEKDSSLYLFLNLGYKPYFTDEATIGVDYRTFFSFHDELTEFNLQTHAFSLYGEKDINKFSMPVRGFLVTSYKLVLIDGSPADNLFSNSYIAVPGFTVRWSEKLTSRFFYKFQYDDFDDFPERDAYNNSLTFANFYRLYDGRLILSPGVKLELNSANDIQGERSYTFWSPTIFLDASASPMEKVILFSRLHYYYQDYYNDEFERRDNQFGFRILLQRELYKALYLDLAYDFIYNDSSSDVLGPEPFKYKRNVFTVGFSLKY